MTQNTIVRSVLTSRKHQLRKPLSNLAVKGLKWEMADLADLPPHEGLRVETNKSGAKSWYYRYRVGNKLRQVTIGSYPSMDLAEARDEYRQYKKLKGINIDPKTSQQQGKELLKRSIEKSGEDVHTFERMIERYIVEKLEKARQPKGTRIWGINNIPPYMLINNGVGEFTKSSSILPETLKSLNKTFTTSLLFGANHDGWVDIVWVDIVVGGAQGINNKVFLSDQGHFSDSLNGFFLIL